MSAWEIVAWILIAVGLSLIVATLRILYLTMKGKS